MKTHKVILFITTVLENMFLLKQQYCDSVCVCVCVCVCVFVDIVAIWLFNILIANVKYFRYEENSISYNLEIQPLCLILLPEKIESTILIGDFIYGHTTISALCLI
jgi:hypothetical protein